MFSITSCTTVGIEAKPVSIETDISFGMGNFTIVGLPDASVKEARDRIRSAIKHTGFSFPRGRITGTLAPADIRKQGPLYDLPIALSLLLTQGEIKTEHLEQSVVIGELALDGSVRPVRGSLICAMMAKSIRAKTIFVPIQNTAEACAVTDLTVIGVSSLKQIVDHLLNRIPISPSVRSEMVITREYPVCFSHVKGQHLAKRGLEIAAAGGHNILLSGPPGTGKTLLARALPSILPDLSQDESIETTCIASIAGVLDPSEGLIQTRPFRSPHHSSSAISLVGGRTWPQPGEISLAHRGVLFLDEFPEFPRHVLEHLRQPLEDGFVTISRAHATVRFPARFTLIAAMNPCPCGYLTDPKHTCTCTPTQIDRYRKRISGPLLDRLDLRVEVSNIPAETLMHSVDSETSASIRERIVAARIIQSNRFSNSNILTNSEIPSAKLKEWCTLSNDAELILLHATNAQALSPRAYTRILKVARTIADLSRESTIQEQHIAEALQFREQTDGKER